MAFRSGWGGRVKVSDAIYAGRHGHVHLPVSRWQISINTGAVDVTAGPATIRSYIPDYTDVDIQFDCFWENELSIFDFTSTVLTLVPGLYVYVFVTTDATDPQSEFDASYILPSVLVTSVVVDSEVRGIVKYTVTGKQSGDNNEAQGGAVADTVDFSYPAQ